jgi:D-alanyl-lipoteichoic acid acyltransferase DltB (MBOAT superfamily)
MLFHSKEFLFYFLPIVFLGWSLLILWKKTHFALVWLTISSLVFYAYWNPIYLILLAISLLTNFQIGKMVDPASGWRQKTRLLFLVGGLLVNLLALGYFKYFNFFVTNINELFKLGWTFEKVILPLAISFFTFQQIAYLVDSYRRKVNEHSLLNYAFFVCFFPQLIAGPIVHHSEIFSQITSPYPQENFCTNLIGGLSVFLVGLFKKVGLADSCGELVAPIFDSPLHMFSLSTPDAWAGVLAYTFQIYFDFSGYSDMAIGIGLLFGIRLPENFCSPYRATNMIDFWRRWHITLSKFLRDYLYIPLGGNRRGILIRYRNLMITMLLGGIWHGAGWTFLVWGALHGFYLTINHLWRDYRPLRNISFPPFARSTCGWLVTFSCVLFAWVFFRAPDLDSALSVAGSLIGVAAERPALLMTGDFATSYLKWPFLVLMLAISLGLPNTQTYFRRFLQAQPVPSESDELETRSAFVSKNRRFWLRFDCLAWRPDVIHGVMIGFLLFFVIRKYYSLAPTSFLYFNF